MHWLDGVSKRQRRVTRSTFAAEINGLADSLEPGKVIAMQFAEILEGVRTAEQMAADYLKADWPLQVEAVVDANGVFTAIAAPDVKLPLEESLITIVMAVREQFSIGLLRRLWWCCTDDMLSDGLTKGSIAREPLLRALAEGRWILQKEAKAVTLRRGITPDRSRAQVSWKDLAE